MSVNVSDNALNFISTLDNSDFVAKSLQDIALIETRLRLTGDISGVTKYDQAVKDALATETTLRANLNKILDEAQIKYTEVAATLQAPASKTAFSDSAAEVAAYQAGLEGLESGVAIVADLNDQLATLAVSQNELKDAFDAGTISEAEYEDKLGTLVIEQQRLVQNIQQVNDAFAENVTVQTAQVEATGKTVATTIEEIGILNELKATLAELNAEKSGATDLSQINVINKQIDETSATLAQFGNRGKSGFDELGNAVEVVTPTVGKFQSTISRLTDFQNIASRAATQFSRQIIGLGVGFISLEIGAKAIESLVKYIENLDILTGRLDTAKQNFIAFNEVMQGADKAAGAQVASLNILSGVVGNLTFSLNERLKAANALKDEFPNELAGVSSLTIANQGLKGSYDDITTSIIKNAQATSIIGKLSANATQELDANLQIRKINNARSNQLDDAYKQYNADPTAQFAKNDLAGRINEANAEANSAIDEVNKTKAVYQSTATFLVQFAKQNGIDLTNALTKTNQQIQDPLKQFSDIIKNGNETNLKQLKTALDTQLAQFGLTDSDKANIKAKIQEVDDALKTYQVKATPKTNPAVSAGQTLLAQQTKQLQEIDALKDKYAAKEGDRNDQAKAAIEAAFTLQVNNINALNKKYDDYVSKYGSAAAKAAGLHRIDSSGLQGTETNALASLAGQQSLDGTKDQVSQQKVIFQEYEDFKLKAGTDAANELYGNELKGFTSYYQYLKSLEPSEAALGSANPYVKAQASALQDYLKTELPAAFDAELKQKEKQFQDLLIQNQSYQQQLETAQEVGNANIKQLLDKGYTDQALQAKKNLDAQLSSITLNHLQTLTSYQELFEGIKGLTVQNAQDDVTQLRHQADSDLVNGDLSIKDYIAYIKQLDQALVDLKNAGAAQTFSELGTALSGLSSSISNIDSNLGAIVSSAAGAVSSIGKIISLQNALDSSSISDADRLKDNIDLVATGAEAALSVVTSLISASKARKAADEAYYNSVLTFQQQYNVALDEQQRLQYQTDGNFLVTDTAEELLDAAKAYKSASDQYNASLIALQKGQAIVGTKNVVDGSAVAKDAINGAVAGAVVGSVVPVVGTALGAAIGGVVGALGGLFGGKKAANVLEPLLEAYPQLIDANGKFNESLAKTLVANNQVDDSTKTLLNNTIAYYDEEQTAIDQITSALESLVGTLGDSISNALVSAFENGSDAATAFGTTVSGVLSNIIQQDLFDAIFGTQLQTLKDELTADALKTDGTTTEDIIGDIENFYKDSGGLVSEFLTGLQTAQTAGAGVGLTLFPSGSSTSSLSGAVQASITEDTANILAGAMEGIQLNTLTTNNILNGVTLSFGQLIGLIQDQLNAVIQIQSNTFKSANNSDLMVSALNAISANTGATASDALRAAGFYGY